MLLVSAARLAKKALPQSKMSIKEEALQHGVSYPRIEASATAALMALLVWCLLCVFSVIARRAESRKKENKHM